MTARTDYLSRAFTGYLDRRSVPQHLAGKERAQADEFSALHRALVKCAPEGGYQEWWPRFEDALDSIMRTRVWPVVNEVRAAAKLVSKDGPGKAVTVQFDPVAINLRRLRNGDAIGEAWLFGTCAVDLLREGASEDDFAPYRSSLFFSEKDLVGDEIARKREAERRAKHDAARQIAGLPGHFNASRLGAA